MGIETAIKTALENDATLSSLAVTVWPHVAAKSAAYPFIVYSANGSDIENYINGVQANLTLTRININLDIYTDSVQQREQITTQIKNLLHGFSGDLGTENLNIRNSILQSVSTFSESDLTGTDEQIYRSSLSFDFHYNWS